MIDPHTIDPHVIFIALECLLALALSFGVVSTLRRRQINILDARINTLHAGLICSYMDQCDEAFDKLRERYPDGFDKERSKARLGALASPGSAT